MTSNMFFKTVDEAWSYSKNVRKGVIIELKPRCRKNTRAWFEYEVAVALKERGEKIDINLTPVCLAWNVPIYDQDDVLIERT